MPREAQYTVRKLILLSPEMVEMIDEYRRTQKPLPSESEAIRQLLTQSLERALKKDKAKRGG
ncbi:MAG: hypothetical protein U1A78_40050 [Polyangia bacterium]